VDERLHHERGAVEGRRAHGTSRNVEWTELAIGYPEVVNEAAREFACRYDRRVAIAGNHVAESGELAVGIGARFEVVIGRRPIVVMGDIVFTGPEKFHWNAWLAGLLSFVGDQARDLGNFNVVFLVQASSETAAGADHMERDVGCLNASGYRRVVQGWNLSG